MSKTRKKTWAKKVELVRESYQRACNRPAFAAIFYENLFYLKPKIKDYFKNTDFAHQEKAILMGMNFLMSFLDEKDGHARKQVVRIARSHSVKNMNIHPHDYYYWIEALIMSAKQCDQLWHDDLAYYWRECLNFPVSFIVSQYYLND